MSAGLTSIRNHPGVESVSDEREYHNGRRLGGVVFVNLKLGWSFDFSASCGGFDTLGEAMSAVARVRPATAAETEERTR